jgi:glycosyltransferase involved in cell wall biosynthesis
VLNSGARLLETSWDGYGPNKNKGVAMARHDWILSLDADEMPDEQLTETLSALAFADPLAVYNIRFRAFLGNKMIRFGEWAGDAHIRLYHRQQVHWNEAQVHEALEMPGNVRVVTVKGYMHHYTSRNLEEFAAKTVQYAMLNAEKYHRRGKRSFWLQRRLAGPLSFVNNYLLRLGFLDGEAGYTIAKMNAWYTWMKYTRLKELAELAK